MKFRIGAILTALALISACAPTDDSASVIVDQPHADELFDAAVQETSAVFFHHVPEAATQLGLSADVAPDAAHRLLDRSVDGNAARTRAFEAALARLVSIDVDSLSPDRRMEHAKLTTIIDGMLAPTRVVEYGTTAAAWNVWYSPYVIVQNAGPTVDIPNFLDSQQPVTNAEEAEAFLARLADAGRALDGSLESFRRDVQLGAIPPDFIVEKSLAVVEAFIEPEPGQNSIYLSFSERLEEAGIANASDYADRALRVIDAEVIPAYRRIADYLGEIRSSAPHDAGIWRLPNGEALYAAMIWHMTDTTLPADAIHQTGLNEIERITGEMDEILRSEGYVEGTVGERMLQLAVEPRFLYSNDASGKQQLLDDVRAMIDEMDDELPNWFHELPKHRVEVIPVPEFSQDSAPGGYYLSPAPDGSRPGYYVINLRDTALLPSWSLPTLTYHEASPGHHLDVSTAMDLDSSLLSKALFSNAAGEGWGLYAEQLAAEMGMYANDPYGDLGRLKDELFRAVRLVVDTGIHAKKWSREQAIEYMVEVGGQDEPTAISEVERYVVMPGQALGYKIGQLKILELRDEAKQALGDAFDIRDFNQTVLNVTSAPLPYIETAVREWIAASTE